MIKKIKSIDTKIKQVEELLTKSANLFTVCEEQLSDIKSAVDSILESQEIN